LIIRVTVDTSTKLSNKHLPDYVQIAFNASDLDIRATEFF